MGGLLKRKNEEILHETCLKENIYNVFMSSVTIYCIFFLSLFHIERYHVLVAVKYVYAHMFMFLSLSLSPFLSRNTY